MIYRSLRAARPRNILASGALAACLLLSAAPAAADHACEQELSEASAKYRIGRFEEAMATIARCRAEQPKSEVEAQLLALEAKIHIALDDLEAAEAALVTLLRLEGDDFVPNPETDPPRLLAMVKKLRQKPTLVTVSSVSKTPESLREAPATVTLITAEEIERRGYRDLDALFDDLSGFNISRSNGVTLSNIYTRGYRSDETNRTMFLVDGVEENDLWSNTVYWSRQFPISNVERVEVIYGPASTMYGANAFAGVVNIITKRPVSLDAEGNRTAESLIPEGKSYAVRANVTGGSFDTGIFEATAAGQTSSGSLRWMVTGRVFQSDEQDLSDFEFWDYDKAVYETAVMAANYRSMLGYDPTDPSGPGLSVSDFIASLCSTDGVVDSSCVAAVNSSPFFEVSPTGIALTDGGLARAIALDQSVYDQELGGAPIGFSDPTDSWLINGKVELQKNLVVGFQAWRTKEGATPWYTDQLRPGGDNGNLWTPEQNWFYLKYSKELGDDISIELFSQYKEHTLDGTDTALFRPDNYVRGALNIADLALETEPSWGATYFYLLNTQLRNELKFFYHPSERFSLVGGVEVRNGSLQGNYILSSEPNPSETGSPGSDIAGGNRFRTTDLGAFVQATYRPERLEGLKFVAGGRVDDNSVRETQGYGMVFNPRLAVVYSPNELTFKAIYSESFLDASNFFKYATDPGVRDLPNPGLQPETAKNLELSASWQISEDFSVDLVAYDSDFSGAVQQVSGVDCGPPDCETNRTTSQFQATGALSIQGLQLRSQLRWEKFEFWGNYSYFDPFNEQTDTRVGDIASHQLNLGANAELGKWNANLRLNYVGTKDTGADTDVTGNPFDEIDSYLVAHAALTYRDLFAGGSLQLTVNNLFDEQFFHPGLRGAEGVSAASRLPQPGRAVYLRLSVSY
ncbi:MAG: TonB-dependent receptor plug domain-containing protein [bacterium]|nr:TonB-dependent receptor plug domain-containing protein [bacterium]